MKDKLEKYIDLINSGNKIANLTGYKTQGEIEQNLIQPSLAILPRLKIKTGSQLFDLGTGAGIPGIPMAIALPDCQVTVADSNLKKIEFLTRVQQELELENLLVVRARGEDLGRLEKFREKSKYVLARSLGGFGTSLELMSPLTAVGGKIIIYRGREETRELDYPEVKDLLGLVKTEVWNDIYQGKVWVFDKQKPVEEKFPRKTGRPAKREMFLIKGN